MFKTKQFWYILLFAILYIITAGSSFYHAILFFGLANNSWMSIILAFAFEVGQAAVLFSLLTSTKDRNRIVPWVLMLMFTIVQVVGNVFSSYKYLILNSVEDLKYFKEPIFIWTQLPDQEATVIVTWAIGAILPICSLLLTSMITNYLSDQEELKKLNNKQLETSETKEKQEIENDNEDNKKIDTNIHEDNINTEEDQDNDQENTEQINYEDINISEEPISIIEDKDNIKEEIQETEIKGSEDSEKQEDNYDYENKVISYEDQKEKVDDKIEDNKIEDNKKEENKKESHFINLNK